MKSFLPCFKKEGKGETDVLLEGKVKEGGGKTIGFVGGVSLLLNNITGPAMVTMPLLFQNAGWLTPTVTLIVMTMFGTLASTLMCEAMAMIPGNHHFEGRVEFSTLVSFFFGKKAQIVAQIFINISLQCANVAAIIECSQVADDAIIAIFHKTCGFEVYPNIGWQCVTAQAVSDSPFSAHAYYLFTIGFIFMMVIVIPMGLLNLDDNIFIQVLADIFLVVITVDFLVTFILHGIDFSNVPMFKSGGQSPVLGVIMANYAYVTTVPSWCSEKKRDVSVNKSLWIATITSSSAFFILGFFGALSFKFPADSDILSVINASAYSNLFTRILAYLFPLMILATTIPVFSIIVRYNLLQSHIHKGPANFLAVVLPWLIVIPFLTGSGLNNVLNWGTLLFTSVANFVIPFAVYIRACRVQQKSLHMLNQNQKQILEELNLLPKNFGSINDEEEINPYKALPEGFPISSRTVAIVSAVVLSMLVAAVIGLNIESLVASHRHPK